jgi:hypothetical protein
MRARVVVLATLLVGGCGGEESDTADKASPSAGADPIPAAQWSQRVEELCDKNADRAEPAQVDIQRDIEKEGASRAEFVARVLERSVELTEPMLDKLAALPPPAGKEEQAKRFEQELRNVLPTFEDMAAAVRDGDRSDVQRASRELLQAAVPARALARELEIRACIPRNQGS